MDVQWWINGHTERNPCPSSSCMLAFGVAARFRLDCKVNLQGSERVGASSITSCSWILSPGALNNSRALSTLACSASAMRVDILNGIHHDYCGIGRAAIQSILWPGAVFPQRSWFGGQAAIWQDIR